MHPALPLALPLTLTLVLPLPLPLTLPGRGSPQAWLRLCSQQGCSRSRSRRCSCGCSYGVGWAARLPRSSAVQARVHVRPETPPAVDSPHPCWWHPHSAKVYKGMLSILRLVAGPGLGTRLAAALNVVRFFFRYWNRD